MSPKTLGSYLRRIGRRLWTDGMRTALWVAVVTALIWVYADMEHTVDREFNDVTIRFTTGKSENLVILSEKEQQISFKAEGNRSSLDALEQRLREQGSVIHFDVSGYGPGQRYIGAEEILNRSMGLAQEGLSLVSATPSGFNVRLDQRILVADVPVELQSTGADLAGAPVITPPKVAIRVARSQWEELKQRNPSPVLKTAPVNLAKLADPAQPVVTVTAELEGSIDGIKAEPQQRTVKARVEIRALTDVKTVMVSIHVAMPATWLEDGTWQRYAFVRKEPREWRKTITVSGPKRDLDQLKPEDVLAFIVLNDGDKQPVESSLTREAVIHFPENLQVKLVGERPKVSFKLEPAPAVP